MSNLIIQKKWRTSYARNTTYLARFTKPQRGGLLVLPERHNQGYGIQKVTLPGNVAGTGSTFTDTQYGKSRICLRQDICRDRSKDRRVFRAGILESGTNDSIRFYWRLELWHILKHGGAVVAERDMEHRKKLLTAPYPMCALNNGLSEKAARR